MKIEVLMTSQMITEIIYFSYLMLMYHRFLKEVKAIRYFILYRFMNIISLLILSVIPFNFTSFPYIISCIFILIGAIFFGFGYSKITATFFPKIFFSLLFLLYLFVSFYGLLTKSTLLTMDVLTSIALASTYIAIVIQSFLQPDTQQKKRYKILITITWVHAFLYMLNIYYGLQVTEKSLNYFHSSGFTVIFLIMIQLIAMISTVSLVVITQRAILDKHS